MPTIRELMTQSEQAMADADKDVNAPKVLFYHVSGLEPHQLYMQMDEEVNEDVLAKFNEGMERLMAGQPVQYIKGKEYFFSREFIVNEDVLIPRYETEELVEQILYAIDDYFKDYDEITLTDVGTGSGAIAISLALEEPKLTVSATDISEKALVVARENAKALGADVTFYQGDMLQPLIERGIKVDIFVSNPPYIPQDQNIDPLVKDNEPHVALFGGEDGLYFYRLIFKDVKKVIKDRALLAFEMGFDQRELMEEALEVYFPGVPYTIMKDMSGKDRMLMIYYNLK
ncbi:MAG: peptide chain release factor N(5)-glutamine methyltransferase [Erysipelotrichaceae bacterium]|nr:peptide chain release factor N(5)-glutamine methyltransferase [Erysipelotrichaceae bacterium]